MFQVGDRVVVVKYFRYIGEEGTIVRLQRRGTYYRILLDNRERLVGSAQRCGASGIPLLQGEFELVLKKKPDWIL